MLGQTIEDAISDWMTILLLPLHAAINPLLYSIFALKSSKLFHKLIGYLKNNQLKGVVLGESIPLLC